jgi:5-methylcytosine-specific restriction endonuclease McrA
MVTAFLFSSMEAKKKRVFSEEYKAAQRLRTEKYRKSEKFLAKKNSPEFKEKAKAYRQLPSSIHAAKLRNQSQEVKEKQKIRNESPDVKAYKAQHAKKPESKLKKKIYSQTEKSKAAKKKYLFNYYRTEEYKIASQKRRETQARKEYIKKYFKTPKGAAIKISINENRRAVKSSAPIGDLAAIKSWLKEWKSHENVCCHWCGNLFSPNQCHVDHVIPISRGGAHCLSNLVVACAKCNMQKHDKMPEEWLKTLAIQKTR